jgi:GntR family transcriptional repressor for pyruvate dehydrogenase complex
MKKNDVAPSGLKKIKKATMAEMIIEQILGMIQEGVFQPGQKLPSEKELAEILSVSRPTLREAMRSLMTMGLIEIRCGDGTYLNDSVKLFSEHFKTTHLLNRFSFAEVLEARRLLECHNAYLAAQNATEEDIAALEAAYEDLKSIEDYIVMDMHAVDRVYHTAIANCAKNRFIKEMLQTIEELNMVMNVWARPDKEAWAQVIVSSKEILDAIKAHDAEKARALMEAHIQDAGDAFMKRVQMVEQEDE